MGDLPEEVQQFLELDRPDEHYDASLEGLVAKMRAGKPAVMDLVLGLGEQLVSVIDPERMRATILLARVMERVPEQIQPQQLGALAGFFGERLGDWKCVRSAMAGCTALLRRGLLGEGPAWESLPALEDSAAAAIAASFVAEVHVQSLQALDRLEGLRLLRALLRPPERAAALLSSGVDLAEAVISSVDGEKDPRCLLVAFECVGGLASLFPPNGSAAPEPLDDQWEELHSVISCYFPVSFHPPRNMANPVTRDDIVQGLQEAMTCHPRFAEFTVPLLLEKATSPSKRDLEDSMAGLVACCAAWGEDVMRPHAEKVWQTLEIHLTGEDEDDARHAADCLRSCCRAMCPSPSEAAALGLLPGLALEAQCWTRWMTDLQELAAAPGAAPPTSAIDKAAAMTENTVRAFAAVAGTSLKACQAALNATVPILIDTAAEQRFLQGMSPTPAASAACRGIALTAVKGMINAGHEFMAYLQSSESTGKGLPEAPLKPYCDDLTRMAVHCDEAEDGALDTDPPISTMRLQVLGVLCNAPPSGPPVLSPKNCEALTSRLLDVVQSAAPPPPAAQTARPGPAGKTADSDDPPALACTILRRSALALSGCPAYSSALPRLLAALSPCQVGVGAAKEEDLMGPAAVSEDEDLGWAGAWPLQALMAISEADEAFRRDAISGLGSLVADQMGTVIEAAVSGDGKEEGAGLAACMAALEEQHRQQTERPAGPALLAQELMAAAEGCCERGAPGLSRCALEAAAAAPWLRSCARVAATAMLSAAPESQEQDAARVLDKLLHHAAAFEKAPAPSAQSAAWLSVAGPIALAVLQSVTPSAAAAALAGREDVVLEALRLLACPEGPSAPRLPQQTRTMAAIALASLVNKLIQQQPQLPAALLERLQKGAEANQPPPGAAALLGWVARGLAMAGRPADAGSLLGLIPSLIASCSSKASPADAKDGDGDEAMAAGMDGTRCVDMLDEASRAYGYVLGNRDFVAGGVCAEQLDLEAWGRRVLSRQFHCTTKMLWEQRTLVTQMEALKARLANDENSPGREVLQLTVLWLIAEAPNSPLQKEMAKALPLLLDALGAVTSCPLPGVVEVLPKSIYIIEDLLPTKAWGPWLAQRVDALVGALLQLCGYREAAAVRAAALRCLLLVSESVEYTKLHPMAKKVRREIDRCLDDPKRMVRLQAVKTKHKWSSRV